MEKVKARLTSKEVKGQVYLQSHPSAGEDKLFNIVIRFNQFLQMKNVKGCTKKM